MALNNTYVPHDLRKKPAKLRDECAASKYGMHPCDSLCALSFPSVSCAQCTIQSTPTSQAPMIRPSFPRRRGRTEGRAD